MRSANSKRAAVVIAILLFCLVTGVTIHQLSRSGGRGAANQAAAPAPPSTPLASVVPVARPARPADPSQVTGTVRSPDGLPLPNVEVLLATPEDPVGVYSAPGPNALVQRTGPDGRFAFPASAGGGALVVARGVTGYAHARLDALADSPDLVLQPWAKIEGVLRIAGKPTANRVINLRRYEAYHDASTKLARHDRFATTDAAGRFAFEHVAPGAFMLSLRLERPYRHTHVTFVDARPGETARSDVGRTGRTITAQVEWPLGDGLPLVTGVLFPKTDIKIPLPAGWPTMTGPEREAWTIDWRLTPAGQAHYVQQQGHAFDVPADGALRVEDIPPGEYRLRLTCALQRAGRDPLNNAAGDEREITVPGAPHTQTFDLGTIPLKAPARR